MSKKMKSAKITTIHSLFFLLAISSVNLLFPATPPSASSPSLSLAQAKDFVQTYCIECHNTQKIKGDVDLSNFDFTIKDPKDRVVLNQVMDQIHYGEMPPKKAKQPEKEIQKKFIHYLDGILNPQRKANANHKPIDQFKTPNIAGLSPTKAIDQLVDAMLSYQGISPNAFTEDHIFLRRAYLTIIGRIPTLEETEMWERMRSDTKKRSKLIRQLINSEGYDSRQFHFWADLLRVNRRETKTEDAYSHYIKGIIKENRPYDQVVRDLISATGEKWNNGAVGYYDRDRGMPLDNMANTVRIFMGTRLECAQCHNHPFQSWTQMDFYKMASFTYGMGERSRAGSNYQKLRTEARKKQRKLIQEVTGLSAIPNIKNKKSLEKFLKSKKGKKFLNRNNITPKELIKKIEQGKKAIEGKVKEDGIVYESLKRIYQNFNQSQVIYKEKSLTLPEDYQYSDASPKDEISAGTMYASLPADMEKFNGDKVQAYAEWMTSPRNPTFTKTMVNRIWRDIFGIGIFEPHDDITDKTIISNPALLAYLEKLFIDLNYDIKALQEIIFNTKAWQRKSNTLETALGQAYFFQGPPLKRMSAEQIWDSLVSLAIPKVDYYKPKLVQDTKRLNEQKLMYNSLETVSFERYKENLRDMNEVIDVESLITLQKKIVQARKMKDAKSVRSLTKQYAQKQRQFSKNAKAYFLKNAQIPSEEEMMRNLDYELVNNVDDAGIHDGKTYIYKKLPKLKKRKGEKAPYHLTPSQKIAWQKLKQADARVYTKLVSRMARASELQSPERPGHFLRDFGQSDRIMIENASRSASVPQALTLLNGPAVDILINSHSVLGKRIRSTFDRRDQIELIFKTMYSRLPKDREYALIDDFYNSEQLNYRESRGLIWALMNTQRFLFIE